jgi:hypothetical protein
MKWVESLVYGDGELRNKRRTPRLSPEWPLHSSATDSLSLPAGRLAENNHAACCARVTTAAWRNGPISHACKDPGQETKAE